MTRKISKTKSKLADRLAKKIEKEFGVKCRPETFRRTYAGYWMKLQGAFVWEMDCIGGGVVGSMYPASELAKGSVELEIDEKEGEIFPK